MDVTELLAQRGYSLRKHLEEVTWTARKLTVVDLDADERRLLETAGVDALSEKLAADGHWIFPAVDITAPLPLERDAILARGDAVTAVVIAPADVENPLREGARRLALAIKERFGVVLPILSDTEASLDLLDDREVVLFGGAHNNRLAQDLAFRFWGNFVDAACPSAGGWLVTTRHGLTASGRKIVQIAADEGTMDEAVDHLLGLVEERDGKLVARSTHHVVPGPEAREHLPTLTRFLSSMVAFNCPQIENPNDVPEDPIAAADFIRPALYSGGPEVNHVNNAPHRAATLAVRHYLMTGDEAGLRFFHRTLWHMVDYYLGTPEGESIFADFDFYLGHLVMHYMRLEHHPIFTEEDRLVLPSFLLGCARVVHEYFRNHWKNKHGATPHNHQTFTGRTFLVASDYFARHGAPDTAVWRREADAMFSGDMWKRWKYRENANSYEQLAPMHAAEYSGWTGNRTDLFTRDALTRAAERLAICTDNFFRRVDYGDCNPTLAAGPMESDALITIAAAGIGDEELQWHGRRVFEIGHCYAGALLMMTGLRSDVAGREPESGVWELAPADPLMAAEFAPEFPADFAFDKLGFRTGWTPEAQYVLFEGLGSRGLSHSHNDVNAILRVNHLGRHWIVSNGYGRRPGLSNAGKSFASRINGSEEQNVLVLYDENGEQINPPLFAALLDKGGSEGLAWARTVVPGFAGTDWFRTVVILADRWVLVVDQVRIGDTPPSAAHIEWNALGEVMERPYGWRLEQQGVALDVSVLGEGTRDVKPQVSASWQAILGSAGYPYAEYPPHRLILTPPSLEPGGSFRLATLLAATTSDTPAFQLAEPAPGKYNVGGAPGLSPGARCESGGLRIEVTEGGVTVTAGEPPAAPPGLNGLCARA